MVGTCNGLLYITGNGFKGFVLANPNTGNRFKGFVLANPVTGEMLNVPLLVSLGKKPWKVGMHKAYSFAYYPTMGRYKIVLVHFPVYDRWTGSFDLVRVFTLKEDVS
ncbi:hypothetical protein E2562_031645 [Oryza meyeriana var. granulata]|uniref:Uncharacterized protein n=1 Tax=Oryza meyeriana var. granulata TaxID=110450 RepID=A0A6G1DBP0_9ORYZ|nr:hypothetical protein E2562_031645 [Oryza meyeriana var. granulata]